MTPTIQREPGRDAERLPSANAPPTGSPAERRLRSLAERASRRDARETVALAYGCVDWFIYGAEVAPGATLD